MSRSECHRRRARDRTGGAEAVRASVVRACACVPARSVARVHAPQVPRNRCRRWPCEACATHPRRWPLPMYRPVLSCSCGGMRVVAMVEGGRGTRCQTSGVEKSVFRSTRYHMARVLTRHRVGPVATRAVVEGEGGAEIAWRDHLGRTVTRSALTSVEHAVKHCARESCADSSEPLV